MDLVINTYKNQHLHMKALICNDQTFNVRTRA